MIFSIYWKLMLPILISSIVVVDSIVRGPHHPRGDKIVRKHTHYRPEYKSNTKLMEDDRLMRDIEHIQEDLEKTSAKKVDITEMSEEELELYYFLLHDSDKNNKLDGLELLNAILHTLHNDKDEEESVDENIFDKFVYLIDQVLQDEDRNHDGYLDYSEYVESRRRAQKTPNPSIIL